MTINDPALLGEVTAAFYAYEAALMADDIAYMDALFCDSELTIRFGVGEVLYGMEEIREFRRGRGGSPQRTLGRVSITVFGDSFATSNAEFFREGVTVRGRQSQSWVKFAAGWKIVSAHVSMEGTTA
jgi:Protein of unknown function (DUF3225)